MRNILSLAILSVAASVLAAADVVIVHAAVPDAAVSADELKNIYLGKKSNWSDSSRVNLVILGGDAGETFIKERVGRSAAQFKAHWKKEVFNGRGSMPAEGADAAAVIKAVAETPGAIGYVPEGQALPAGVKALTIN